MEGIIPGFKQNFMTEVVANYSHIFFPGDAEMLLLRNKFI